MSDHPEAIARAAGLVLADQEEPGLTRRRRGTGFSYHAPDGTTVGDDLRQRIVDLVIPPAWDDVWIAPDPDSHILATGLDDAGRKQYLYHPRWREAADTAKFSRLADFGSSLVRLRKRVAVDLTGPIEAQSTQAALVTRILDHTLIRVGSRCYVEENGSFGATTLLNEHVDVSGPNITLSFVAKGGHDCTVSATDRHLARRLGELVEELAPSDPIFHDDDGRPISRTTVNHYIEQYAGARFSAKDFRTFGASSEVTGVLGDAGDTDDPDAAVRAAVESAAELLGNTPTVCRNSYVAPAVIEAFHDGDLAPIWSRTRGSRWLDRAERACSRILGSAD